MDFRKDSVKLKPLSMFSQSGLTDIILLLLIFFLLTSSFVTNFGIRVNVPQAESSVTNNAQQISVAITAEGDFFVDGEQTTRGNLSTFIRQVYQNKPSASLVVRADRDAKVDDAVHVMNIGQALNMNIVMATERD
ncbi:ExbD/TolR family protein [Rhodohalobacter barkolensis]|uniref:Biopolymer transporter ExbD n=1 Tax=Rhodohalobacter barkolensis TaxID=2053187 RepID=A0A2N0VGR1_9BACT|nr:biopolymer transporter ExbD [Rhodohalobacter barkolensis]PKD43385.1 biopolymer transporter ExbD [Rhodohalobacter barkolensis]